MIPTSPTSILPASRVRGNPQRWGGGLDEHAYVNNTQNLKSLRIMKEATDTYPRPTRAQAIVLWGSRRSEIERLYYQDGLSKVALAKHYGVSNQGLTKAMRRLGLTIKTSPRNEKDPARTAAMASLYHSGKTLQEIAGIYGGLTRERVRQILAKGGFERRPRGGPRPRSINGL